MEKRKKKENTKMCNSASVFIVCQFSVKLQCKQRFRYVWLLLHHSGEMAWKNAWFPVSKSRRQANAILDYDQMQRTKSRRTQWLNFVFHKQKYMKLLENFIFFVIRRIFCLCSYSWVDSYSSNDWFCFGEKMDYATGKERYRKKHNW